ncbi:MAG: antitoxin family protein [Isosphaeraceae bacterium]
MNKTLTVIFDGEVFRPREPVNLTPNSQCVIVIQSVAAPTKSANAWDVLDKYTGSIEGPGDWSAEHDHYLYGTPKRSSEGPV